jgi:hypothetical protein
LSWFPIIHRTNYLVGRVFPPLDFDFIEDLSSLDPAFEEDFIRILLLLLLSLFEVFVDFPLKLFPVFDPLALLIFLEDLSLPAVHDSLFLLFFELFPVIVLKRVEEEHVLVLKPKVVS